MSFPDYQSSILGEVHYVLLKHVGEPARPGILSRQEIFGCRFFNMSRMQQRSCPSTVLDSGAALWVIISEIYPTKARSRAISMATTMLRRVSYLGNQLFPLVLRRLPTQKVFVASLLTKTKDRSLAKITHFRTEMEYAK